MSEYILGAVGGFGILWLIEGFADNNTSSIHDGIIAIGIASLVWRTHTK